MDELDALFLSFSSAIKRRIFTCPVPIQLQFYQVPKSHQYLAAPLVAPSCSPRDPASVTAPAPLWRVHAATPFGPELPVVPHSVRSPRATRGPKQGSSTLAAPTTGSHLVTARRYLRTVAKKPPEDHPGLAAPELARTATPTRHMQGVRHLSF